MAELEQRLSSAEYSEWIEYWNIEPWGAWRDNLHAAQIASLIFNTNRGKDQAPVKPADFMYQDKQTTEETKKKDFVFALRSLARKTDG